MAWLPTFLFCGLQQGPVTCSCQGSLDLVPPSTTSGMPEYCIQKIAIVSRMCADVSNITVCHVRRSWTCCFYHTDPVLLRRTPWSERSAQSRDEDPYLGDTGGIGTKGLSAGPDPRKDNFQGHCWPRSCHSCGSCSDCWEIHWFFLWQCFWNVAYSLVSKLLVVVADIPKAIC